MPVGAVAAVIFSVIIGVACLRLGGAYVALLTFAIAEAMYLLIITDTECFFREGVTCRNFTGGTRGLVNFGNFGFQQLLGYKYAAFGNYFLALALLALATAFSVFVIRGPVGTAFAALRDNTTYCHRARHQPVQIPVARLCRLGAVHGPRRRRVCRLFLGHGRRHA